MARASFSLNLAPKEAIKWLESRGASVKPRSMMAPEEAARSFTVANISSLDMLQNIQDALVRAAENGTTYAQFKKDILNKMQLAGWLHKNDNNKTEIIDPDTGEVFGHPRRLEVIFSTNMQSAFSAGRWRQLMRNVDSRPYLQYSAVHDSRTRPAHMALDGLIFRYDHPFWSIFYPPNGHRCRCTVVALGPRDIERRGLTISSISSGDNFVEVDQQDKYGRSYTTQAYRAPNGTLVKVDKGFGYNVGQTSYRPDLDFYDRHLAQCFAEADMNGPEFKAVLERLRKEVKKDAEQNPGRSTKFAAGILSAENQELLQTRHASVWLSSDVVAKYLQNMATSVADDFYQHLPNLIREPDLVLKSSKNTFCLVRKAKMGYVLVVIRQGAKDKKLQINSYRAISDRELAELQKKCQQLK